MGCADSYLMLQALASILDIMDLSKKNNTNIFTKISPS